MNWSKDITDLDLFSMFRVNKNIDCNVFFASRNCVSSTLLTDNKQKGSDGGETLEIKQLGAFNYTYAVNRFQDRSGGLVNGEYNEATEEYNDNDPQPRDKTPIILSRARINLYSPHYKNAIGEIVMPDRINQSTVIGTYNANAYYDWWILFCIDGSNGIDTLKVINKFSFKQPSSSYCTDIGQGMATSFISSKINMRKN